MRRRRKKKRERGRRRRSWRRGRRMRGEEGVGGEEEGAGKGLTSGSNFCIACVEPKLQIVRSYLYCYIKISLYEYTI